MPIMVARKRKRQFAVIIIVFVTFCMIVDIFSVFPSSDVNNNDYIQSEIKLNSIRVLLEGNIELEPKALQPLQDEQVTKRTNAESIRHRQEENQLLSNDSSVVHRHYWNAIRIANTSFELEYLSERERKELREIFKRRSLWGDERNETFEKSGFSSEYDWRVLSQLVWQYLANEVYSDLLPVVQNVTKKIVLYDGFGWWNYKGGKFLQCQGNFDGRCEMFEYGNIEMTQVDAVVSVSDAFHKSTFSVPSNTSHIDFILESPYATPKRNLYRRNDFLASYWRGAEIPAPYATWAYYDPNVRQKKRKRNYAKGKTKMAAMFVSNCNAINDRLGYVEELQKHMAVDIYGSCGDARFHCSRGNKTCFEDNLKQNYRFYLAFENSNCRDYITEKFFLNALENNVIPIVMGGHIWDYKARAPQHSFIHIDEFSSPKELAQFLNTLAKDDSLYNEYFRWKGTGEFINTNFLCRVCAMLWYNQVDPPPVRKEAMRWRPVRNDKDRMCAPRGNWHWNKGNYA